MTFHVFIGMQVVAGGELNIFLSRNFAFGGGLSKADLRRFIFRGRH